jgi:hypothetical protein
MPRFKPGQDVVALVDRQYEIINKPLVKGNVYTVEYVGCCCKESAVSVVGIHFKLHADDDMECAICARPLKNGDPAFFSEDDFAPLDELLRDAEELMAGVNELLRPVEEPEELVVA